MFHKRYDIKKDMNKKIFSSSCSWGHKEKEMIRKLFEKLRTNLESSRLMRFGKS